MSQLLRNLLYKLQAPEGEGAPGGAAPAAPASSPAPAPAASSPELSFSDIENVLKFDPFDPSAQKPDGEAPPPVPGNEPAAAKPPEPTPAPVIPPPDQNAQKFTAMEQQLQQAMARIEQLSKPPEGGDKPEDEIPPYEFTIPAPLMQALDSEDPAQRQQAIGTIMAGTARAVHKTVMAAVAQHVQQLTQAFPEMISNHISQSNQARSVFDDFYGTFKDLNNPVLRPTVVAVAGQVLQELNVREWTPQVKTEIAKRVYQALGRAMPGAMPPAPPEPPPMLGGGVRPNGAGQQNDIMNTLF